MKPLFLPDNDRQLLSEPINTEKINTKIKSSSLKLSKKTHYTKADVLQPETH